MGYSDDACKCFFTPGQKTKMWTVINNCRSSLKTSQGGNPPTGIKNYTAEKIISISPNPFYIQTTLQTKVPLINATLTVDNCFGQTVAQIKNINGQTVVFSRDNLASGLYFIRLTEENKIIAVDKLVIVDE